MTAVAIIFPGQGSQYVGMGKDLYDASEAAAKVIDLADQTLGNGLKEVMFSGPEERLMLTSYSQPAIFAVSMAAYRLFQTTEKFKGIDIKYVAGLSLGEYSALAACEALSLEETIRLIERRSAFMEEAAQSARGKMAAIMGVEAEKIKEICLETGAEVANYNSLQQTVITGHADKVDKACALLEAAQAKVVPLNVSGAFHSSLMRPAQLKFLPVLEKILLRQSAVPLISNVDATPTNNPEKIRSNLARQITSSVRWVETIQFIAGQGIQHYMEIGPGSVLKGLMRRIDKNLNVMNIGKLEDIQKMEF